MSQVKYLEEQLAYTSEQKKKKLQEQERKLRDKIAFQKSHPIRSMMGLCRCTLCRLEMGR